MAPNIPRKNTVALHFAKKNTRLQVNMFSIIAVITITFDISYFLLYTKSATDNWDLQKGVEGK